jgi:hypothetical protein
VSYDLTNVTTTVYMLKLEDIAALEDDAFINGWPKSEKTITGYWDPWQSTGGVLIER